MEPTVLHWLSLSHTHRVSATPSLYQDWPWVKIPTTLCLFKKKKRLPPASFSLLFPLKKTFFFPRAGSLVFIKLRRSTPLYPSSFQVVLLLCTQRLCRPQEVVSACKTDEWTNGGLYVNDAYNNRRVVDGGRRRRKLRVIHQERKPHQEDGLP